MCGKKSTSSWFRLICSGSPPHVREKVSIKSVQVTIRRITPACAGKRVDEELILQLHRDHPRMCGKKFLACFYPPNSLGSPPHVREKERDEIKDVGGFGITPACAGKRNELGNGLSLMQDHPRMCGKKSALSLKGRRWVGSPPHVREKGLIHFKSDLFIRITPACAGKRSVCWWC